MFPRPVPPSGFSQRPHSGLFSLSSPLEPGTTGARNPPGVKSLEYPLRALKFDFFSCRNIPSIRPPRRDRRETGRNGLRTVRRPMPVTGYADWRDPCSGRGTALSPTKQHKTRRGHLLNNVPARYRPENALLRRHVKMTLDFVSTSTKPHRHSSRFERKPWKTP